LNFYPFNFLQPPPTPLLFSQPKYFLLTKVITKQNKIKQNKIKQNQKKKKKKNLVYTSCKFRWITLHEFIEKKKKKKKKTTVFMHLQPPPPNLISFSSWKWREKKKNLSGKIKNEKNWTLGRIE
jgi:hypothetical protein